MSTPDHYCPGFRALVQGDELDCPACRAGLLTAFRDPAAPPLPGPVPVPHTVIDDPGRTVDLSGLAERVSPTHDPRPLVTPHADRPGGVWNVTCSCGWLAHGTYARDGMGELTARRLSAAWADRHALNPLEDPPPYDPR